ncbi:hypothetical protein [Desulfovirgula thermocuniculi]|nr:hypothetical protein [Desulfovirgula thermocuniculi]
MPDSMEAKTRATNIIEFALGIIVAVLGLFVLVAGILITIF